MDANFKLNRYKNAGHRRKDVPASAPADSLLPENTGHTGPDSIYICNSQQLWNFQQNRRSSTTNGPPKFIGGLFAGTRLVQNWPIATILYICTLWHVFGYIFLCFVWVGRRTEDHTANMYKLHCINFISPHRPGYAFKYHNDKKKRGYYAVPGNASSACGTGHVPAVVEYTWKCGPSLSFILRLE